VTQPGRGGQQPAPINSAAGQATVVGTQPGVTGGIVRARQVIVSGSGEGVFVYDGAAGAGTLVASITGAATTADGSGNAIPAEGYNSYNNYGGAIGWIALNVGAGVLTGWQAASEAGPWSPVAYITLTVAGGGLTALGLNAGVTEVSGSLTVGGVDIVLALSGQPTTTDGLTDGTINGSSATTGLPNGGIQGTSGSQSAGTAHTHGPGSYSVTNGMHSHTAGSYAVTNGQHSHDLPVI
jgi:hypothetical protein